MLLLLLHSSHAAKDCSIEPVQSRVGADSSKQIFFNFSPFPRLGELVQSWVMQNQDYSYTLLSKEGAEDFVKQHYSPKPKIAETFLDLEYPIFRADHL